ncbi:helix-turn-helix domain-containing protein, partial [Cereibacter sphaeroides]|uniref:TetR/AcrR family transcriptional regulator n=1 Tax=Cereibacter sphaeroides TaxID=1063 RepID=UPI002D8019E2
TMADAAHLVIDPAAEAKLSPRERLIDSARSLFCRYGINSVGVDAIIEQAGTAKTTLYKLFGSKDGLVEAVLEREGQSWRSWF